MKFKIDQRRISNEQRKINIAVSEEEITHDAFYLVWKCEQLAPKLTQQESEINSACEQGNDLNLFFRILHLYHTNKKIVGKLL